MTIAACLLYVLIVLGVSAWLLYEIRADNRDHDQYRAPTIRRNRDRMPPMD